MRKGGKSMNEENVILTKQQLLEEIYLQYHRQKELCDMKYNQAMKVEENESNKMEPNRKKTKQENTDLKEYNQQVSAVCRTASMIIAITKSNLPVAEEELEDDELI